MRCEFSEFSYGFAVTHEIVTTVRSQMTSAPLLPSLDAEATLGFDVLLDGLEGWTYAAQFKIPEHMTRSNSLEWDEWNDEYFRFHTRTSGDQHDLLLGLEQASIFNIVLYICPCFATAEEFNTAFVAKEVEDRSLKLRPSEIGHGPHAVTFDRSGKYVVFSQPRAGATSLTGRSARNLRGDEVASRSDPVEFSADSFDSLREELLGFVRQNDSPSAATLADQMVRRRRELDAEDSDTARSFADLALASRMLLGVQLFALPSLEEDTEP